MKGRSGHPHVVGAVWVDADHRLPREEHSASSAAVEQGLIVSPVIPLVLVAEVVQRDTLHGVAKYQDSHGWVLIFSAVPVGWSVPSLPDEISQLAALADKLPLRFPLIPPQSW